MVETPAFAIEFAKIALLTNVGRINTTMACEYRPRQTYSARRFPPSLTASSLSRDENCSSELPPGSLLAEDRWEPSRRSSDQELPEGGAFAF